MYEPNDEIKAIDSNKDILRILDETTFHYDE
jgi:hypothetical protein